MPAAALPPDEAQRLETLRDYRILDSAPEPFFDDLTRQAMAVCGAPVGLVSLVDRKRQWFKSRFGMAPTETPREHSMCAHALLTPEQPLVVPDTTQDPRFVDFPNVTGEDHHRFYAGVPLRSPEGHALGTLCVLDRVPRQLSADQLDRLRSLAQQVSVRLSLRRHALTERRLTLGFGTGVALILGLSLFFAFQASRFLASDGWVSHANKLVRQVERTLFEVQAAESSQRGYTATGRESYLPPCRAAMAEVPALLDTLRQSVSDDPVQQANLATLAAAVDTKLATIRERLEQRRTLGVAALNPRYLDGRGVSAMEAATAAGNRMARAETELLHRHDHARASGLHNAVAMWIGTSLVGAGLLWLGFLAIRRELRRGRALGGALAQANLGLEREVTQRREAQGRLAVQGAVAHIAAGNVTLAQAAPLFLREVCAHLHWQLGELWTVDPATQHLRLADHWHAGLDAAATACFVEATRHWTFVKGDGLPGRAWADGTALWEHDLQANPRFLRTAEAQEAGLGRAFAFPLGLGADDRPAGIMVFLGREQGPPDDELVGTMNTLAGQIAQFTERCRAEAALRASQTRFSAFIENAPALAYIKDDQSRMLYGNETLLRTFGLTADQWLGKTDADFWPESAPAIRENDRLVLAGEQPVELNESVPVDGQMRRWLSYKFPLLDEATGRQLLAGMSIDITAREEAEENRRAREEAERGNREKSRFLSRVSHELRTPLNAILGFGQLLQLSGLRGQDAESLDYILKGGKHLLGLVDEVLDLSRAESGELHLNLARVDGALLADECAQLVARLASDREVACETLPTAGPRLLWCDEQRLRQILLNLLSNAIKYNRPGGRVTVSGQPVTPGRFRFEVRDTGPGILPADQARLFVPFERLEHGGEKTEGVGLGLVLSRRMAEAMGGTLEMTSEIGQGSTFRVELPLCENQSPPPAEADVSPEDAVDLLHEMLSTLSC